MFGAIAPRYDLLNHLLSLSADRYWRWRARRVVVPEIRVAGPLLDLCTGTGDLALEFCDHVQVVGCDFSHPMLLQASSKLQSRASGNGISLVEGDALRLPFRDASFSGLSIAFGLRNLEDYASGLAEMHRVLKPSGFLVVLEFSQPTLPGFKQLYRFYFTRVLPRIGQLVSGASGPYQYLPRSVGEFPGKPGLAKLLTEAGFEEVRHRALTAGIVTLQTARKPESG